MTARLHKSGIAYHASLFILYGMLLESSHEGLRHSTCNCRAAVARVDRWPSFVSFRVVTRASSQSSFDHGSRDQECGTNEENDQALRCHQPFLSPMPSLRLPGLEVWGEQRLGESHPRAAPMPSRRAVANVKKFLPLSEASFSNGLPGANVRFPKSACAGSGRPLPANLGQERPAPRRASQHQCSALQPVKFTVMEY